MTSEIFAGQRAEEEVAEVATQKEDGAGDS